ncbi:hypothetical protein [Blastococcus saxobsidens]|uniref:Uncharacterized protein n=1 Tax=Blastococcus saxobsidens TaxID=138336 RepID=A0A4Q7Y1Z1_9ACTN|nr:hypothetical protein [Blastococcus saxobsidens]RZU30518.1 hypothetical protein BKA19_0135 [Blastococcus saxobsidens]
MDVDGSPDEAAFRTGVRSSPGEYAGELWRRAKAGRLLPGDEAEHLDPVVGALGR